MFYRYEIKNNGIEDVLYLYLTMSYEFSKELSSSSSNNDLERRANNFIKNNNIDFDGAKVYLVVNDIIVKSLNIKNNKEDIEILSNSLFYSNDSYLITLKLSDNSFIEITLREYLLGLIANNMVPNLNIEVLKAMAVLYRGYSYKEMSEKKFIDNGNAFAVYKPISYYKLLWLNDYDKIFNKINMAITETDCIFPSYNKEYILPFMHLCNDGKTDTLNGYDYLESVHSLWDLASPNYIDVKDYTYLELSKLLKCDVDKIKKMIITTSDSNILSFKINNITYNISTIKKLLNLNSKKLVIIINNDNVRFISKGYGDFYGMSLYGALSISNSGCDYLNILKYYFPKIKFNKYIKELSNI